MRRVLLIDDDRDDSETLTPILSKEGHSIQVASDLEASVHRIKAWKPHLILLKLDIAAVSTSDLIVSSIARLRAASPDDYLAVILVSSQDGTQDASQGLDLGADDFISKPFKPFELVTRMRTMLRMKDTQDLLRKANHRIEEISSTDDLTGLMNMRTLQRKGQEELIRSRRLNKPASALLINLDRFSDLNQKWGFNPGNAIIQETGRRIKQSLRSIDLVARVGADEFFALLMETDLANAEFMAERIRDLIQSQPFIRTLPDQGNHQKDENILTVSIGVTGVNSPDESLSDLFHCASEALRSAKEGGMNRVEIYSLA